MLGGCSHSDDLNEAFVDTTKEVINKRMLPSELKKLQRSKKSKKESLIEKPSCFVEPPDASGLNIPTSVMATPGGLRKPLGRLNANITNPITAVSRPTFKVPSKTSWTLLKQLTISSGDGLSEWKKYLTASPNSTLPEFFTNLMEQLTYHRFPYPELPSEARNKLSKIALENSFEGEYFKNIIGTWRKAFISLYNEFRVGRIPYFYYLQSDLVVLFRATSSTTVSNSDRVVSAYLGKYTNSLTSMLKSEGIFFESILEHDDIDSDYKEDLPLPPLSSTDEGDQENIDPRRIKETINARVNRQRRLKSEKRTNSSTCITIVGESQVHCLVDYILHQKDGKSYVVMPELISPAPFQYGTLCKAEISVTGPVLLGDMQVKITGLVLPSLAHTLSREVFSISDSTFQSANVIDDRTTAFLPIYHL